MGKRCVLWSQFFFGAVLPSLIQLVGTLTPFWLIEDGVNKGFFYQINYEEEKTIWLTELDQATFGLQVTSCVLLVIVSISCGVTIIVYGPDKYDDIDNDDASCLFCCCCSFYCSIVLYVCTGIFSLAGCARFSSVYPLEHISVSFYLCLASSLVIWLNVLILICDQLCKKRSHKNVFNILMCEIYEDIFLDR